MKRVKGGREREKDEMGQRIEGGGKAKKRAERK